MTAAGVERRLTWLYAAYLAGAVLTMAMSARLWWQSPMVLTPYEFDYFLGYFRGSGANVVAERVLQGRALHLVLFGALGVLYAAIVLTLARWPDVVPVRRIAVASGAVALAFVVGMPWVSPDVFFYIGTGWVDAHHGLNPYQHPMASVPGHGSDPMFANVHPPFLTGTTSYGPLFQKLAGGIAALSGGSVKLALGLHKAFYLLLHGVASLLVYRMAAPAWRATALFGYAANPLILFSVLTCAHNDHLMNVCVLASLWWVQRRQALAAGVALGTAFSLKYFPLVYLPILLVVALLQSAQGRLAWRDLRAPALLAAGFMLAVLASQRLYPASTEHVTHLLSTGVGVYRSSIFHLIDAVTRDLLPALLGLPQALVTREDLGGVLRLAYMGAYALLCWRYWPRLRREPWLAGVELCLLSTLLYFVLVNTSNQEWYVTWMMGLAFMLPSQVARTLALWLSVAYVPLVIYTVRGDPVVVFTANLALYLLILGCAWWYARHQLAAAREPAAVR